MNQSKFVKIKAISRLRAKPWQKYFSILVIKLYHNFTLSQAFHGQPVAQKQCIYTYSFMNLWKMLNEFVTEEEGNKSYYNQPTNQCSRMKNFILVLPLWTIGQRSEKPSYLLY